MMRAGYLQKCDVKEESGATDFFRQRTRAKNDSRNGIPDGDMGSDSDLLR